MIIALGEKVFGALLVITGAAIILTGHWTTTDDMIADLIAGGLMLAFGRGTAPLTLTAASPTTPRATATGQSQISPRQSRSIRRMPMLTTIAAPPTAVKAKSTGRCTHFPGTAISRRPRGWRDVAGCLHRRTGGLAKGANKMFASRWYTFPVPVGVEGPLPTG